MSEAKKSEFVAEVNSSFEPWLIENICKPALKLVPESVHPNYISLAAHFICWTTATLAYISTAVDGYTRMLVLMGAGVTMFGAMMGDCLDGMQARRTDRCSKLGEMMDHWLDAVHVPLVTVGLTFALNLESWQVVLVHITNTMIYNSQLVLYHHKGRFVGTDTSGADAEVGVSLGYVGVGILYFFVDPSNYWIRMAVTIAALYAIYLQIKLNYFYYKRLGKLAAHTIPFVVLCGGFGALYMVGGITRLAFLLCVVFCSFRITGGYVQFTIIKRKFNGFDAGIALWIVAMAAVHYMMDPNMLIFGFKLYKALPLFACLYMAGRSLWEFVRYYHEFLPEGVERNEVRPA